MNDFMWELKENLSKRSLHLTKGVSTLKGFEAVQQAIVARTLSEIAAAISETRQLEINVKYALARSKH
jgi:hypothetical protein